MASKRKTYMKVKYRWDRIAAGLGVGLVFGMMMVWGIVIATN